MYAQFTNRRNFTKKKCFIMVLFNQRVLFCCPTSHFLCENCCLSHIFYIFALLTQSQEKDIQTKKDLTNYKHNKLKIEKHEKF